MEGLGKEGRKMEIRKWGREADISNWEKWQQTQKDIYRSTKRRHGEERYLQLRWGDRRAVVLKMLFSGLRKPAGKQVRGPAGVVQSVRHEGSRN